MTYSPITFSGPMVRALIEGRKTQTRRVLKPWPGRQTKWLTMELLHRAASCYTCEVNGHYGVQMQHPLAGTTQPYGKVDELSPLTWVRLPYAPGDRLWVREAWSINAHGGSSVGGVGGWDYSLEFRAGGLRELRFVGDYRQDPYMRLFDTQVGDWRSPIHMPRWASRLTLTVTEVRVQRLKEISEADAEAEGVEHPIWSDGTVGQGFWVRDTTNIWSDARSAFQDLWGRLHGARGWDANPWVVALTFTVRHGNIDTDSVRLGR